MSEFINEESKLLKEEKQVIWEMFVDWYPFFQKKIKEDLEILELSDNEKEVFELVYLLGFIMSIFDSMKLLRQTKNLDSEIEMADMPSVLQVILNHSMGYEFDEEKTKRVISFLFSSTYLGEPEFMDIFRAGAVHFTNWGKMKADKVTQISLGIEEFITNDEWFSEVKPKLRSSKFLLSEVD